MVVFAVFVGPQYAVFNLGILICEKCAGIHRTLGSHRVKSLKMDKWDEDQLQVSRFEYRFIGTVRVSVKIM